MISKTALLFVIFQSLAVPLAGSSVQQPGDLDAKLNAKVHNYELKSGNLVEALTRVASDFRIPMGIEWVDNSTARRNITLSWKDTTPRRILHAIADQQSLSIIVDSDVVRVSSQLIPNDENPLKIKIKEFAVQNLPTESAWSKLREAAKDVISPPKSNPGVVGGIITSGASNIDDPRISLQLKNMSLEDMLDRLVAVSARKIWIATFTDSRTLTVAGYRRTRGLWTNSPVPDEEQPVLGMFHWGDAIPTTIFDNK